MTSSTSYVVQCLQTGRAVCEIWNPALAARVNLNSYRVWPILEWLQSLNQINQQKDTDNATL
jgi:hypothetical protein